MKVGINGACGRMGVQIASTIATDEEIELVCAIEGPGHPRIGADYGTILGRSGRKLDVVDSLPTESIDVVIDFSSPEGFRSCLPACLERKIPMVVGTTGLTDADLAAVKSAGSQIPIVQAFNMSVGITALTNLLPDLTKALGDDYDVEIVEMHHRWKKDAPSGTAIALGNAVSEGRGAILADLAINGREGLTGERVEGEIGMHALRGGDVVGVHTVLFSTVGETIEVTHRAHSRATFSVGAVRAAKFVAQAKPGVYRMTDVLEWADYRK